MSSGIYKIENNINHMVYIGQTINLEERFQKHKKNVKDINHQEDLYRALRQFGLENFSYCIIEKFNKYDPDKLNKLENYYIKEYNSLKPNGYNMVPGGTNGAGLAKGKKIQQYDLNGNFIKEYSSAHQAGRETGINYSSICACARGDISHTKQFQWKYSEDKKIISKKLLTEIIQKEQIIQQYDLKGNLLQEYFSLKEASEKSKASKPVISKVCNHKGWTAGGYFWCYKDDKERLIEYKKKKKII